MEESTLGNLQKYSHCLPIVQWVFSENFVHLPSNYADKLKYGHTDALGYNKCRFSSTLEAALMNKSMKGEKIV